MQSGLNSCAVRAARGSIHRCFGSVGVLLAGLAVSGCVGSGQIANLAEGRRPATVAFESVDGPPPAVFQKFMKSLKDEAGARQITVVAATEANYRVRGYLAAHDSGAGTAISWALDAYDAEQHRAFRLSGEEKAAGHAGAHNWAAADDATLARIARASMEQFAAFAATAGAAPARSAQVTPAPERTGSAGAPPSAYSGDDWAPESAGIFRRGARPPELAADAGAPWPSGEVPVPRGRPAHDGAEAGAAFAFAPEDR